MKVLLKLENEQTKADREKPEKLCSFCMSSLKEKKPQYTIFGCFSCAQITTT